MVSAKTKAEAVYKTVNGESTETCPASILKKHKNAVLYTEKRLGRKWVYEFGFMNLPCYNLRIYCNKQVY